MLEWVFRRCDDAVDADETPIGLLPTAGALDTDGLGHRRDADLAELLTVDPAAWRAEIEPIREFFAQVRREAAGRAAGAARRARGRLR